MVKSEVLIDKIKQVYKVMITKTGTIEHAFVYRTDDLLSFEKGGLLRRRP